MKITIIVAKARNGGIGKGNALPWRLSSDLKRFKALTSGHHILMGRKTYESIGKPLPNRISLILSKDESYQASGTHTFSSIEKAFQFAQEAGEDNLFVVGGAQIYALALPLAHCLEITEVDAEPEADAFFPPFDKNEWRESFRETHPAGEKNEYAHTFLTLERSLRC